MQRSVEIQAVRDGKQKLSQIHGSVLEMSGLGIHVNAKDTVDTEEKNEGIDDEEDDESDTSRSQTEEWYLKMLLMFTSIICRGDFDEMTRTNSKLTWPEESVLHFEFVRRGSLTRWIVCAMAYMQRHGNEICCLTEHVNGHCWTLQVADL